MKRLQKSNLFSLHKIRMHNYISPHGIVIIWGKQKYFLEQGLIKTLDKNKNLKKQVKKNIMDIDIGVDKMIIRVLDEERANICDDLLTKLIQDERKYDDTINEKFIVKNYFKNVIINKNNILLCYEEDKIIKGYIFLKLIDNSNNKGYLIDGLYVNEKYRNKGIATNLIEKALTVIKEKNADFIDINVMSNNKNAVNLYKTFGFNEFKISLRKNI